MSQVLSVAILKPSALGDIVHALPVLTALRRRFPEAYIGWVVNRAYAPLLEGHPDLSETIRLERAPRRRLLAGLAAYSSVIHRLRKRRLDLIVDLQGLLRTGLLGIFSGARRRIGPTWAREGATWLYTDVVAGPGLTEGHAVDRYLAIAKALGAETDQIVFRLPPFPSAEPWADELLRRLPRPWIMAAVGARWLTKRWLPQHFGELLGRAQAHFGGTVLFVGSAEDAADSTAAARDLRGPVLHLAGATTLPQLAVLLGRADMMVANDTGPLHLAAALGRPVIAPYTCTKKEWTGPYGQLEHAVETQVACAGSRLRTCSRMDCMQELTPDRLWPLVCEVLERWQQNSRSA